MPSTVLCCHKPSLVVNLFRNQRTWCQGHIMQQQCATKGTGGGITAPLQASLPQVKHQAHVLYGRQVQSSKGMEERQKTMCCS